MKCAHGFSLPTAIFLLVILALLGAFMVSLSTTQNITSAQDVQGSRAIRAARSGLEWAAGQICYGAGIANPGISCQHLVPYHAIDCLPAPPVPFTIDGFSITIACSVAPHDEGSTTKYVLVYSTASGGGAIGSLGRVERMTYAFHPILALSVAEAAWSPNGRGIKEHMMNRQALPPVARIFAALAFLPALAWVSLRFPAMLRRHLRVCADTASLDQQRSAYRRDLGRFGAMRGLEQLSGG